MLDDLCESPLSLGSPGSIPTPTSGGRTRSVPAATVEVPVVQDRRWVDRPAVDMNLEVQMAADGAGVSGLAHSTDSLACPNPIAALDRRGADHVSVEVGALLALAVDQ